MLEIRNLSKAFGKQKVLDDITLTFSMIGLSVIVGINGAGKTTLLNSIVGLNRVDAGQILYDSCPNNEKQFKEAIFYLPSDFFLPEYMTGHEYAEFILGLYPYGNSADFRQYAVWLGILEELDKKIAAYSFGMKKKLQIAIAFSTHTPVLIGDEIFSGLDFETTIFAQEAVAYQSKVQKIILVSHEESLLRRFPDNILILDDAHLSRISGTPDEIIEIIKRKGHLDAKIAELGKYLDAGKVLH